MGGQLKQMITNRIEHRMELLEAMLTTQLHLRIPSDVQEHIATIAPYWAHLSDEDKDYIECAKSALENQTEWLI